MSSSESIFDVEIWHIKIKYFFIFLGFVILVCIVLAIVDYCLKTPTYFRYSQNFWDRAYDFLDEYASVGVTAATLLAVIVALVTGLASFIQTRDNQLKESKRRMLSEVFDWANEVAKTAISRQTTTPTELWATKLKYKYSLTKSKYVDGIVWQSFNPLVNPISEVKTKLELAINATDDVIEDSNKFTHYVFEDVNGSGFVNNPEHFRKLRESEQELTTSVEILLTEIASLNVSINGNTS